MRNYLGAALLTICFMGLVGCSEIRQYSTINTSGTNIGNKFVATLGDAVVEVVNRESMPNVFGAADIFGRTRATGTTSLIFIGGDAKIANFIRRDVDIQSSKTTMNSSPTVIQNNSSSTISGISGGQSFTGRIDTFSAPIFLPPNTPPDTITGVREVNISVPIKNGENTISIGGTTIEVLRASANQLHYSINK